MKTRIKVASDENYMIHKIGVSPKSGKDIFYDVSGWPPVSKLKIYSSDGGLLETLSRNGKDVTDTIMLWSRNNSGLMYGFSVKSKKWKIWDERTLEAIERFFIEDFAHDALLLDFTRISGNGLPCSEEAIWSFKIT